MPDEIPVVVQRQIIDHLAEAIAGISGITGLPIAVEFARGGAGLVIKANAGDARVKTYINGQYLAQFPFMVLSTVLATDGKDSVLAAAAPLLTIADYFDTLTASGLSIGTDREAVKVEMTTLPQDMAGVQDDGTVTFFGVFTLTYRKKG